MPGAEAIQRLIAMGIIGQYINRIAVANVHYEDEIPGRSYLSFRDNAVLSNAKIFHRSVTHMSSRQKALATEQRWPVSAPPDLFLHFRYLPLGTRPHR